MSVPMIMSDGYVTVYVKSRQYQINKDDNRFNRLIKLLKDGAGEDKVFQLVDTVETVKNLAKLVNMKVEVVNGVVYVNGVVCKHLVAQKITEFASLGLPFKYLVKFLTRLLANPSEASREHAYTFLANKGLPITEDGHVLGYKAVRNNWTDKHTGTVLNKIGSVVQMDRKQVDDNTRKECSTGLHVGTLNYVERFRSVGSGDRTLIVKFDPADIVSVPSSDAAEKIRVSKYTVVAEYGNDKKELDRPVYSSKTLNPIDQDDDDYDADDVSSEVDEDVETSIVGYKPNGQKFHNKRDAKGRFIKA